MQFANFRRCCHAARFAIRSTSMARPRDRSGRGLPGCWPGDAVLVCRKAASYGEKIRTAAYGGPNRKKLFSFGTEEPCAGNTSKKPSLRNLVPAVLSSVDQAPYRKTRTLEECPINKVFKTSANTNDGPRPTASRCAFPGAESAERLASPS